MIKHSLLVLALVLGLALPANALITRGVGPASFSISNLPSGNTVLTGTTAGRSLVISVLWYDPASNITISSITISGESNATLIAGSKFTNHAATTSTGQIAFLANNVNGGDKTVTITFSGATYADITIMEYAGMNTGSQPDNSTNATGTDPATTSLTTLTPNALIVAIGINTNGEFTAGSGYSLLGMPNSLYYEEVEDNVNVVATGATTVDFTGFAANWAISAASFKAVAGAATAIRHGVTSQ